MEDVKNPWDMMYELKGSYMEDMRKVDVEEMRRTANLSDTISLYHGTTTAYLNDILELGILPRAKVQTDNWETQTSSLENFTYLTNKWHYFYASNANMKYLTKKYGDEEYLQHLGETYPCYIEISVPKSLLVTDEDSFISNYMLQKAKRAIKKGEDMTFDWMESLSQYGTVGVLGAIPPHWIRSFTILGEPSMYLYVMDETKQYHKDYVKWQSGKGKGVLKEKDLLMREKQSDLNGTWWVKDIPKGAKIGRIGLNEITKKLSIQFARK